MDSGVFGMMIIGGILLIFWFIIENEKTQTNKKGKKQEELDEKIKYQNFILAVKEVFPQAQYKRYGYGNKDFTTLTTSIFNTKHKKIGVIEFSGSRDSWGRNAPITFDVNITITIAYESFEKKVERIDDKFEDILFYINIMLEEVYSKPDFQKIFIALNI